MPGAIMPHREQDPQVGGASCCHSQASAFGSAACQALPVSPALSLMKGTCSNRLSAAVKTVAGR